MNLKWTNVWNVNNIQEPQQQQQQPRQLQKGHDIYQSLVNVERNYILNENFGSIITIYLLIIRSAIKIVTTRKEFNKISLKSWNVKCNEHTTINDVNSNWKQKVIQVIQKDI